MRGIHLLGLRNADGSRLRFYADDSTPLILPWWIPEGDREVLLAFYQQVIADDLLVRIEVDWMRAIIPADREFLQSERRRHGAEDRMVVVRLRHPDVDLRDVLAEPSVSAFRRVAIVCEKPARNETVGTLQQLGRLAMQAAEARYEVLAEEFGLRDDGHAVLLPIQQQLLNPITAVETYNTLIDLHREGVSREQHADAVLARVVGRELEALSPRELVGLCALAIRGEAAFKELLGSEAKTVREALRARMLLRDGRLVGWAQRLTEHRHREVMETRLQRHAAPNRVSGMTKKVVTWSRQTRHHNSFDPLREGVLDVFGLLNGGQLQRAQQELDALEPQLVALAVSDDTRLLFGLAQGRLLQAMGRWPEAEATLRGALQRAAVGKTTPINRGITLDELARGLRDNGRWPEAEPLFREALRLLEEGNDAPEERGITMHELACGLRDNGRWPEAEPPVPRSAQAGRRRAATSPVVEAIRWASWPAVCATTAAGPRLSRCSAKRSGCWRRATTTPRERGITMDELARGLRDNGRWPEAEPLFREALRLLEEGNDTPISRGFTMDELARGLRDNGRWPEAEPLFREALRLLEEGNDTPISRGFTMDELARGLRDNGRWPEAEPLFREALRLLEEGNDAPDSRAYTLDALAAGLRDNGCEAEADALQQQAQALRALPTLPS